MSKIKKGGLILVAIAIIALFFWRDSLVARFSGFPQGADPERYQAVFLSNGQIYFGRLKSMNRKNFVLENVHYLQVNNQTQNQTPAQTENSQTKKEGENPQNQEQNPFVLLRVGSEVHQPEDRIVVAKDHVIFWENLEKNSEVSKAIDAEKN